MSSKEAHMISYCTVKEAKSVLDHVYNYNHCKLWDISDPGDSPQSRRSPKNFKKWLMIKIKTALYLSTVVTET